MKIWDYIKDKLFNKKKELPEPKENIINKAAINSKKQVFDESLKVKTDINPNTLEFAIDQYMLSLINQKNLGQENNKLSYNALVQLGAIRNTDSGNNGKNQNEFFENINKKKYGENTKVFYTQYSQNGVPEFYHVSNCGGFEYEIKEYRIYLNCKKENVALLANEFANELKDNEYYFKFNSDEIKNERSEQFVFYMRNQDDLNINMTAIEKVKQKNPKLFEGSHCINPFLKTFEGYLGYAPEITNDQYVDLNGNTHYYAVESYNDLLSKALEDSVIHSGREIIASREGEVDLSLYSNITQMAGYLEKMYYDSDFKTKFIENVKQNLKIASEKNPTLDIKGIDTKTKNQEKNIADYTPESY